jgi:hypothetical protein
MEVVTMILFARRKLNRMIYFINETMMKGIKKILIRVREQVSSEIRASSSRGYIAASMAGEGYAGGYRDAINDILLLLNEVMPQRRNYYEIKPNQ